MKILHLSDLHIDSESESTIAEIITEAISSYSKQGQSLFPEVLVITGDFTNKGSPIEFENAKKVIEEIKAGIPSIKECVIVPGNHDYIWKENDKEVSKDKRGINYNNFKKSCEQDKLCNSNSKIKDNNIKQKLDSYLITHSFVKEKTFAVLIIGMNSDMIESIDRSGQGYFDKKQHSVCKNLINYYKKICKNESISLVIMAAFHHHVLPVSSVERDTLKDPSNFSLTLDARRTLDFFMENGVRIAIHGHQHQPSIVSWEDKMNEDGESIYVIATGSMAHNRNILGDVSKNNFMIYDINEKEITVFCFQNLDRDLDVMTVCHEPYHLMLKNPYLNIKCNINKNAHPPKEIVVEDYCCDNDISNLFYLFLNVVDCSQAHKAILKFSNNNSNVTICGVHHLYGKYDILLKYRAFETEGVRFSDNLQNYLQENNYMLEASIPYFINVSYENKSFKEIKNIPLIKSPEAYLSSTWNMAVLTVYLGHRLTVKKFMQKLNDSIMIFDMENNTKIGDIIRDYAIGQDQSVIFEIFISCYQFPMLTRFTNMIEEIIRDYGIDKSTHIIYYFDERCI